MKKLTVSIFLFLTLIAAVSSTGPTFPKEMEYCVLMGYEVYAVDDVDSCIFPDNTSCDIYSFYNKTCGEEYFKPLNCISKDKHIFPEFQTCCENLYTMPVYDGNSYICTDLAGFDKFMFLFDTNKIVRCAVIVGVFILIAFLIMIYFARHSITKHSRHK